MKTSWLKATGLLLVTGSVVYVLKTLWDYQIWYKLPDDPTYMLVAITLASLVYAICCAIQASGWWVIICGQQNEAMSWLQGIGIFGHTQLAKYIPGNVFHYVGRHLAGYRLGLDHRTQAWGIIHEIATMVFAAASIILCALSFPGSQAPFKTSLLPLSTSVCVLIVLFFYVIHHRSRWPVLDRYLPPAQADATSNTWRFLFTAWLLYVIFFLCCASILWWLAAMLLHGVVVPWFTVVYSLTIAWLSGFITPGASAGIGIRESLLILLLSPQIGTGEATLLALSYRAVTIGGDLCYFLLSQVLMYCQKDSKFAR